MCKEGHVNRRKCYKQYKRCYLRSACTATTIGWNESAETYCLRIACVLHDWLTDIVRSCNLTFSLRTVCTCDAAKQNCPQLNKSKAELHYRGLCSN